MATQQPPAGDATEQADGHVIRSPFRPLTRGARRDLEEYDVRGEVEADETGRGGGVVVAERPPKSLREKHELRVDEAPEDVWESEDGQTVRVYPDYVTVDGRETPMDPSETREKCRESARFSPVEQ
ncbi:MAG: hypothetical protein ACI9CA_000030 [Natronomonas sp.]|jgi:hypothetical protein